MSALLRIVASTLLFLLAASASAFGQNGPIVAAASDLKFALDTIAANFRTETGIEPRITYGSSGNFTQQLLQDAPFELFMSADEAYVFQLAEAGKTLDRGTLYAVGRIVVFSPTGSTLKVDEQLADLRRALAEGRIERFAIANPEHAPYGRAAEEALRSQGLWDAVQPKLVLGENVSQAAQYASTGNTQGGIFALSLALSPAVGSLGTFAVIPADWHRPLRQQMVLLNAASEDARRFYDYLQSPPAREIFSQYGFVLPD